MPFNPDASREAAHKRYEKAQQIVQDNPDVSLDTALEETYWNTDWQPGDPTHKDVQENWDYYSQITHGGQIPISQAVRQQQQPGYIKTASGSQLEIKKPEDEENRKSVVVDDGRPLSPKERLEQEREKSFFDNIFNQPELAPTMSTQGSQSLQEELEKREAFQKAFDESAINSAYGQLGYDYSQDPLYIEQIQRDRNAEYDPSGVSEEVRRRVLDENYNLKNPLDWNILGFSSQELAPNVAKNVYDSYFDKHRSNNKMVDRGVVDKSLIDDGHSDESREGLYMTGQQYINYRNAGIPGRDIYDIDPNELYSKQDEMEVYGFIPYITTQESLDQFHDLASANTVNNAFAHLRDARREGVDFKVRYNGNEYSGQELMRNAPSYGRKIKEQMNDESRQLRDKSKASEFAIPHIAEWEVVDEDTKQVQKYTGEPSSKIRNEDGSITFTWPDGTYAIFNDEDDLRASAQRSYRPASDDEEDSASMWLEVDPLVLSNGEKLRLDKAQELMSQLGNSEAVDYGITGWGNPVVEDPFQGGFLPWIADMALGSVPLFFKPTAASQAVGNFYSADTGMKFGRDNYLNGTYSMLSDAPTREQRNNASLGAIALPFTERIYGPLGSSMLKNVPIKPVKNFFANIDRSHPAIQYGAGVVGEGFEEVPGNAVEELMQGYGPSEWYANEVLDENGNPMVDTQGHSIRDTDTSGQQRVHNFLGDAPLAMLGGAVLGGTLGLPSIKGYYDSYKNRNNADNPMDADYENNIVVPLSDEEIRYYNR